MPRTLDNKDEDHGRLPSPADERSVDDEHNGETGTTVKRVRTLDDSSDDGNVSSGEGVGINPS
jgi:hypothetical protein